MLMLSSALPFAGLWHALTRAVHPPRPQAPYLKVSENSVSVKLQQGRWLFSYLL